MIIFSVRLLKTILLLDISLVTFQYYAMFLKKGGTITCVITGPRQYSRDIDKGGLDVPSKLIFSGPVKEDFKQKVQSLLQKAPKLERFSTLAVALPIEQTQQNDTQATSSSSNSSSSSSTSQAIPMPPIQQSVSSGSVSSSPTIKIDDTGSSSSDESDKEEVHPSKRAHVADANESYKYFGRVVATNREVHSYIIRLDVTHSRKAA